MTFLADSGDDLIAGRLNSTAHNAKYTSPQIQNKILSIEGSSVQESISEQVRQAGVFSVLMDETTDVHIRNKTLDLFVLFKTSMEHQ